MKHPFTTGLLASTILAMVTAATCVWPALAQSSPPAAPPTTTPATHPITSARDRLDSMLKPQVNTGRILQPILDPPKIDVSTIGVAVVAPAAKPVNLMHEGSFIVDRTGRLTRTADGQQWELTFEADGRAMQDPPMLILPNLNLMKMETTVADNNRDVRFLVTGVVTEYKGRNYILLEKVVERTD